MTLFLMSYDLSGGQTEFMDASVHEGWTRLVLTKAGLARLPDTTIRGEFEDAAAAKVAFERARVAAAKKLGRAIKIEKRILVPYRNLGLISDKAAALVPKHTVAGNEMATCLAHQRSGIL